MLLLIVAAFLLSATEEAEGRYQQIASIGGSLRSYKTLASWDEARERCRRDGAVLASPINTQLQNELQRLFRDASHFIGVDARFHDNTFVSVEGVPFDDMPVTDMYERLDLDDGECLSMNRNQISVEQCTSRLPYACYKNETDDDTIVAKTCKTAGYTYYENTGSCYKKHSVRKSWDDARATCEAEEAYLVVIDDANEALTLKLMHLPDYPYTFIGLRDFMKNGQWKSVNGKRVDQLYNVWQSGRPEWLPDGNYYCAVIRNSGKIDNYSCAMNREFICKQSPI